MSNSNKHFYNITEVSKKIDVPAYVLRFWEQKFSQIQPRKNKNRRYYREEDLKIISKIKTLLYDQGYTIKGVQKYLQEFNINDLIIPDDKEKTTLISEKALDDIKKDLFMLDEINIDEMEILLEKLLKIKQNLSNLGQIN